MTVFAVFRLRYRKLDMSVREVHGALLLWAKGQFNDITVVFVCHSGTNTVMHVGRKTKTGAGT